jgi:hypothetical protein
MLPAFVPIAIGIHDIVSAACPERSEGSLRSSFRFHGINNTKQFITGLQITLFWIACEILFRKFVVS